jgi:L-alanine-DL-glutamate epimerase-like enolase superfamily enzyme
LDCALWELEALQAGCAVWQLAEVPPPIPLRTTMTLGADSPAVMAAGATALADARALKLKLTGETVADMERVRAVRDARPDAWIGVDANQGYEPDTLEALIGTLVECRISLLEQPFPRGREDWMDGLKLPIQTAADESCQDLEELETLPGRFDVVNIKLDKCGGLTEGLLMARRARALGLGIMVGNMVGTSLAMAPAYVLGQLCQIVDLDGPIFLTADRAETVSYRNGDIFCSADVWGGQPGAENAS